MRRTNVAVVVGSQCLCRECVVEMKLPNSELANEPCASPSLFPWLHSSLARPSRGLLFKDNPKSCLEGTGYTLGRRRNMRSWGSEREFFWFIDDCWNEWTPQTRGCRLEVSCRRYEEFRVEKTAANACAKTSLAKYEPLRGSGGLRATGDDQEV